MQMESSPRTLEVIVTCRDDAAAAEAGGADRLELLAHPGKGGVSPSIEVVEQVRRAVRIPIHVMVREHDGDFCYEQSALQAMIRTAKRFVDAGAEGLVFGALTADGALDAPALHEFLAQTSGTCVTFHRAFDASSNPRSLYEQLAAFPNVTRVLTGGAAPDVSSGIPLLRELIARNAQPTVLVGGGLTQENLRDVIARTGAREIHVGAAARSAGSVDAAKVARLAELLKA